MMGLRKFICIILVIVIAVAFLAIGLVNTQSDAPSGDYLRVATPNETGPMRTTRTEGNRYYGNP
jgi:hypothetical protein